MTNATLELDFLGLHRSSAANLPPLRGLQRAISTISPQLLRSVIASGPAPPLSSRREPLPVLNAASRPAGESTNGTAPLTIFYNGTVVVFDLPHEKAEAVIQLADGGKSAERAVQKDAGLLEKLDMGDLPVARRKSLQRFLEKRKERLTAVAPYGSEMVGLNFTKKAN